MGTEYREIHDAINNIVGNNKQTSDAAMRAHCKVLSVDIKARTCEVETLTGATTKIPDVALMTVVDDGFLLVPLVGSEVIVNYSKQVKPQVTMYSELQMIWGVVGDQQFKMTTAGIEIFNDYHRIDVKNDGVTLSNKNFKAVVNQQGVTFNDGSFGGLTKTPTLRQELNKNNNILNAILTIINGSPITEPGAAPSALQAALKIAVGGMQTGDFTQIENDTVKHGK